VRDGRVVIEPARSAPAHFDWVDKMQDGASAVSCGGDTASGLVSEDDDVVALGPGETRRPVDADPTSSTRGSRACSRSRRERWRTRDGEPQAV